MEKKNRTKEDGKTKEDDKTREDELAFGSKENTIMILNALFQHGRRDLSYDVIPGISMKEYHSKMDSALKLSETTVKNKPSIIAWLRSGLFEDNDVHVPLALLFIAWYEQRLSPDQEDVECNFREIYHFLYKLTTNQPVFHLSHKSANVLHRILSELIEETWPSMQSKLLHYLSKINVYSRSADRKTYSRKRRILNTKPAENSSS